MKNYDGATIKRLMKYIAGLNCTPFVRQYGILYNKWGDLLCQKEYLIKDIHQNLRSR